MIMRMLIMIMLIMIMITIMLIMLISWSGWHDMDADTKHEVMKFNPHTKVVSHCCFAHEAPIAHGSVDLVISTPPILTKWGFPSHNCHQMALSHHLHQMVMSISPLSPNGESISPLSPNGDFHLTIVTKWWIYLTTVTKWWIHLVIVTKWWIYLTIITKWWFPSHYCHQMVISISPLSSNGDIIFMI